MKKLLLLASLFLLAISSSRATLIWIDNFAYPNGCIETNSGGLWICHSPTTPLKDALVTNSVLQNVSSSAAVAPRQDDIHRNFPASITNAVSYLYASFTINVTTVPGGTNYGYIALFYNSSTTFYGRTFVTNGVLPGTYRIGVSGAAGTANTIFPVDLATNSNYQVVISFDEITSYSCTLWINPIGSSDVSVASSDTVSSPKAITAFAFRQASGLGNFFGGFTNLAVATTFDEAATNVWHTNATAPTIVYQPQGFTNFVSVSNAIVAVANGQSLGALTYSWYKGGAAISNPNGNTNIFSFPNPQTTDSGAYTLVVTTPAGLSTTSTVANVSVTFAPIPPTFTAQPPTNSLVYPGKTLTLNVAATGPGPISYFWAYNGSALSDGNYISGSQSSSLTISDITTTNGTTGTYVCYAYNTYGTNHSSNAVVGITNAAVVTIGYLRGLVDPTYFQVTNTTTYYTTTGTVISRTNYTTSTSDECFIQDSTGGISVFYSGASTFRPNIGDVVTVTGPLSDYNSLEEFNLSASDPSTIATIISSNNATPGSVILPLTFTNSAAYGGISNALRIYGSTRVTVTNVYFPAANGSNTFAGNTSYTMVDTNGASLVLYCYSGFSNLVGQVVPPFAYSITGVMSEYLSATVADRSSGYQFEPSDYTLDFVLTAPAGPVTLKTVSAGTITWTAVPGTSYSIYSATTVTGPYTVLASGLTFSTTAGYYQDSGTNAPAKYYRLSTP